MPHDTQKPPACFRPTDGIAVVLALLAGITRAHKAKPLTGVQRKEFRNALEDIATHARREDRLPLSATLWAFADAIDGGDRDGPLVKQAAYEEAFALVEEADAIVRSLYHRKAG